MDRLQWFKDRIGKRVYRGKTTCTCSICDGVSKEGLIIQDELHANYLYDVEGESHFDSKHPITYTDTLKQAI